MPRSPLDKSAVSFFDLLAMFIHIMEMLRIPIIPNPPPIAITMDLMSRSNTRLLSSRAYVKMYPMVQTANPGSATARNTTVWIGDFESLKRFALMNLAMM